MLYFPTSCGGHPAAGPWLSQSHTSHKTPATQTPIRFSLCDTVTHNHWQSASSKLVPTARLPIACQLESRPHSVPSDRLSTGVSSPQRVFRSPVNWSLVESRHERWMRLDVNESSTADSDNTFPIHLPVRLISHTKNYTL